MVDNVKILETKILSDNWYVLRKITYEYLFICLYYQSFIYLSIEFLYLFHFGGETLLMLCQIVKNQQNFRKHAFATCRW